MFSFVKRMFLPNLKKSVSSQVSENLNGKIRQLALYALDAQRSKIIYQALFHSDEALDALAATTIQLRKKIYGFPISEMDDLLSEFDQSIDDILCSDVSIDHRDMLRDSTLKYARGCVVYDKQRGPFDLFDQDRREPVEFVYFQKLTEIALVLRRIFPSEAHPYISS